jgi:hypothetical protein
MSVRQGLLPLVVHRMSPVQVPIQVAFHRARAILARVSRRLVRSIRLTFRHARGPRVTSPLSFIRALLLRVPSKVAVRRLRFVLSVSRMESDRNSSCRTPHSFSRFTERINPFRLSEQTGHISSHVRDYPFPFVSPGLPNFDSKTKCQH